jgi:WD40 repeat protein
VIDILHAFPKGFICGGSNGTLRMFEGSEESRDVFQQTKVFQVHGESNKASSIRAIAIAPSEDNLACTLSNLQTYTLNLTNTDILKAEDMSFDLLSTSVHEPGTGSAGGGARNGRSHGGGIGSAQITGMDACVRKPLVVTCGLDRSVRVWNYLTRTVDLEKVFPEEAYSAAFHPSGLFVLVGFADKLKLMNLLMDDIRPFKDVPIKACRECRFSTGGQYFAAVNGNAIQVFRTYTFDCVATLRAHVGKVRSLQWSADDRTLMSTGMDGALYRWRLKDGAKESEYLSKGNKFSCLTANADASIVHVVGAGGDDSFKEIELPSCRVTRDLKLGTHLGSIVMSRSGRAFYGGASLQGYQGKREN